ncbi:hypothetical protein F4779DRAFT_599823 [Xylariaceae sp. FL0662B]|nr:hypothetical protein F4779DRAFT_599823 [Xylariaceae sp. FL0662B]
MAMNGSPRSVADATRFTSNTPHAITKASASNSSSKKASLSQPNSPSSATSSLASQGRMPSPGSPRHAHHETLEERVRRLRAAHLAAKRHEISRFDRVVDASRKYFDAAHKFVVTGLIGFSGVALLVTAYATVDMMMYNRKRRTEFFALQKQLQADSLEAARLAYMTGNATEEQAALVEEATARAKQSGVSLPPLLSSPRAPQPPGGQQEAVGSSATTAWAGEALTETGSLSGADEAQAPQRKKGFKEWLFGGLKKDDELARDSGLSGVARTADESQRAFKDKATAAFEQERENQRRGGPLDRLGLEGDKPSNSSSNSSEGKKGWW